jgi:hypothetical protein
MDWCFSNSSCRIVRVPWLCGWGWLAGKRSNSPNRVWWWAWGGGGVGGGPQSTQGELGSKRKEFEHYKNRAQTEMAISLQASDGEGEGKDGRWGSSPRARVAAGEVR